MDEKIDEQTSFLRDYVKWLDEDFSKRTSFGKFIFLLTLISFAAPFILEVVIVIVSIVWIFPLAETFEQKMSVVIFIFAMTLTMAYAIQRYSINYLTGLFVLNRTQLRGDVPPSNIIEINDMAVDDHNKENIDQIDSNLLAVLIGALSIGAGLFGAGFQGIVNMFSPDNLNLNLTVLALLGLVIMFASYFFVRKFLRQC